MPMLNASFEYFFCTFNACFFLCLKSETDSIHLYILFVLSALFEERLKKDKKRFQEVYRHVNGKCSNMRSQIQTK